MSSIISALNSGVLEELLQFTDWETLVECSKVCKSWNNICNKLVHKIYKSVNSSIYDLVHSHPDSDSLYQNFYFIASKTLIAHMKSVEHNMESEITAKRSKIGTAKRKLHPDFAKLLGPLLGVGSSYM